MEPTSKPRVKVCCISSVDEARLAVRYGASALGLVAKMPSGPGVIDDGRSPRSLRPCRRPSGRSCLRANKNTNAIIDQQRRLRTNTLQIVDRLELWTYADLRAALPGIAIVQVIHVAGDESIDEACRVAEMGVDALLLDSGDQRLEVKLLGGTGRTHDWTLSRRIRESVDVPLFLAGGLNPTNVRAAIEEVAPYGLDVCSSLRTDGKLDEAKLGEFFEAVK